MDDAPTTEEATPMTEEGNAVWSRLPPELWCEIFGWVGTPYGLAVVSFVCRRWRALYLSRGLLRLHLAPPAVATYRRGLGDGAKEEDIELAFRSFLLKLRRDCSALASLSFSPVIHSLLSSPSPSSLSSSSSSSAPSPSPSPVGALAAPAGNLWVRDSLVRACFGDGGFRALTELDLTKCSCVTAAALRALPPSLLRLNLRGCRNVSTARSAVRQLALPPLVPDDADELAVLDVLDFSFSPSSAADFTGAGDDDYDDDRRPVFPPQLQVLSLADCWRLRDELLAPDQLPSSLRYLCLRDCKLLTKAGMLHLSALTRLEVLDVSQCTGVVTDAVLAAILPAMSRLRELNLSQNKEITFEGLRHLPPSLTTLDVVFCKKLSPRALDFLPPTLRNLNLSYCFFFKNRGDVSLAFPPALRRLNLSGCELLSDGALRDVAAAVPHLRHLNLTECYRLTDVGLGYLSGCRKLETLDISHCSSITDAGVLELLPPSLRTLTIKSLFEDNKITNNSIESIRLRGVQKLTHCLTIEAVETLSKRIDVVVSNLSASLKADYQFTQAW